jgi:hypothetical protein
MHDFQGSYTFLFAGTKKFGVWNLEFGIWNLEFGIAFL